MNEEEAIIHDFLHGPLTLVAAIDRLVAIGYARPDAERLLDEAIDHAETQIHEGAHE